MHRHQLVSRVPRVVGDDRGGRIGDCDEVGDHAVGVQRYLVAGELGGIACVPGRGRPGHMRFDLGPLGSTLVVTELALEFFEQCDCGQLAVTQQRHIGDVVLVQISGVDRVVNDPFAGGDIGSKHAAGQAGSQCEDRVAAVQVVQ